MMTNSIRVRLLQAFFVVIIALSMTAAGTFLLYSRIIQRYKAITDNMVAEHSLITNAASLISAFNARALSSSSVSAAGEDKKIQDIEANMNSLTHLLDKTIKNQQSVAEYTGLKNTINDVSDEIDKGLAGIANNTADASAHYTEANRKYVFVQANGASLTFSELQYVASIQKQVNRDYQLSFWTSAALFFLAVTGSIVYVIKISKRITGPLGQLTATARQISAGNMNAVIDQSLLRQKDEAGSLSRSFNLMFQKLKANIHALNEEKAGVERKVVERTAQLNDEKTRLKASIESLDVGFIMTDASNNVITINHVAKTILCYGLTPQGTTKINTAIHEWTTDLIQDRLSKSIDFKASIAKVLSTSQPITQKEMGYSGRVLRLFMAPVLEMDEGRQIEKLGAVILLEDITEAKILERSKDEFFSIASHELRTPLTAIRGNTSLIQTYYSNILKDKDLAEMINDIHDSSIRLIAIVSDFLDASRLEQGKMQYNFESFALDKVIESIIYELGGLSHSKGIDLRFLDKESFKLHALPEVYGDKNRVKQIVYNLVGNAMNYTEKGSVTIGIQTLPDYLKIVISDTGRGMTPEAQQLLFHKFQQAGSSLFTRDTTRGTGLGLYISRLMVEQMKGHIQIESSTPGKGSVFSFTIPIAKQSDKPIPPTNPTQIPVAS